MMIVNDNKTKMYKYWFSQKLTGSFHLNTFSSPPLPLPCLLFPSPISNLHLPSLPFSLTMTQSTMFPLFTVEQCYMQIVYTLWTHFRYVSTYLCPGNVARKSRRIRTFGTVSFSLIFSFPWVLFLLSWVRKLWHSQAWTLTLTFSEVRLTW